MGALVYAMRELSGEPPRLVSFEEARRLNERDNYGIFSTVNEFDGPRRIVNLKRIRAWHVEIDGNKPEQLLKIKSSPIYPSRVVESKNGYHIYFNAKDATLVMHRSIEEGLVHYFGGDPKAKMVTVLLREPGFYHKKDPKNPFLVREIFNLNVRYTEKDMLYFFPSPRERVQVKISKEIILSENINIDNLTEFLNNLDHERALEMLSGSSYVGGETYTFKAVAKGRKNIFVNGKSTSCFIDEFKRIGAVPGGPTLWQWLRYYNHSDSEIYRIIKGVFGERFKQ